MQYPTNRKELMKSLISQTVRLEALAKDTNGDGVWDTTAVLLE